MKKACIDYLYIYSVYLYVYMYTHIYVIYKSIKKKTVEEWAIALMIVSQGGILITNKPMESCSALVIRNAN